MDHARTPPGLPTGARRWRVAAREVRRLAFGVTLTQIRALPETPHPGVRYAKGAERRRPEPQDF